MALLTVEIICLWLLLQDFRVTPLLSGSTSVVISTDCDPVKHEFTNNIGFDASFMRVRTEIG
jgi:hypothetical protein